MLLANERAEIFACILLQRNSLYRAERFANFGFFCSVNHLGGPLRKQTFTCTSSKGHGLWFVIGGFRSVLFVSCFKVRCFMIVLFLAIIDYRRFLWFFLFLSLATTKQSSTSFLRQKTHSPLRFPSLLFSSLVILSHAGRAFNIVICINPTITKMIDGTEKNQNPFEVCNTCNAIQRISL